nr:hypothetical protein [Bacillus alveayuensis]
MSKLDVPSEFHHPLFYRAGETIEEKTAVSFPLMMKRFYFYYDILASRGMSGLEPWENIEQSIQAVVQLWKEEREQLQVLFANRNRKAAKEPMLRSLSYFLACLYWLNGTRVKEIVNWEKEIDALSIKPMNCKERLQFIFAKCDLYHSFVQLSELFEELNKLYYKMLVMNKKGISQQ